MGGNRRPRADGLLTARAVLILLCAVLVGYLVGELTYSLVHSEAQAILAALPAFGCTVLAMHRLID